MDGNDIASIIIALIGLLGILTQAYFANQNKKGKDTQTDEIKEEILKSQKEARAAREEAAQARKESKQIREQLSANDIVTVSVARQEIRQMYYQLLPHKMISVTDLRALSEMYHAYKAVTLPDGHHPNSWCDALYNEMNEWERVEIYPEDISSMNKVKSNKKGVK